MPSIFHATIDSRNFSFQGFGETAAQAEKALENAWNEHAHQYRKGGRHVPLFDEPYEESGPTVRDYFDTKAREFAIGQGYRDAEPIGELADNPKSNKVKP
jgi:hypothetical protein